MGTLSAPEIRAEVGLTPKERAEARDSFVRNFERQFSDWTEIAKVCVDVRRDKDFLLLGFEHWHAWLKDAAPRSRSYIYLVVGRYEELAPDIPQEDLAKMPLGSAGILSTMAPSVRRRPEIQAAARKKPSEFVAEVKKISPDQHIESKFRQIIDFTDSQWSVVEATWEKYKVMNDDPSASLAIFIEWMCSEVSEWTLHVERNDEGRANDSEREVVHGV